MNRTILAILIVCALIGTIAATGYYGRSYGYSPYGYGRGYGGYGGHYRSYPSYGYGRGYYGRSPYYGRSYGGYGHGYGGYGNPGYGYRYGY